MPELPEVETIKRGLQKSIKGLTILDMETDTPKMVKCAALKDFKKEVKWKKIISFSRKGKLLIINLNSNQNLIFHLKISGRILVRKQGEKEDRFTRIVFKLSKGLELRFADLRKFGWVRLSSQREIENLPEFKEIGLDPLSKEFTFKRFLEILEGKKGAIKKFLMNQKFISGIGNIYANEILWKVKIHPERRLETLTDKEKSALYRVIISILKKAIKLRGTSIDQYVDAFGNKGEFGKELQVYQRTGKGCQHCGTLVVRITSAGRGTFFCPKCQKLNK